MASLGWQLLQTGEKVEASMKLLVPRRRREVSPLYSGRLITASLPLCNCLFAGDPSSDSGLSSDSVHPSCPFPLPAQSFTVLYRFSVDHF